MNADAALLAAVRDAFAEPPDRLGVAFSGGGDSMALLHAVTRAFPDANIRAATVDHGLREGSKAEAARAKSRAETLGVPHDTLTWTGWDGTGNLQAEARSARYALLKGWADSHSIEKVLLGHTRNDQAETVLLRLARGAGVDGLAAMPAERNFGGVWFLRPFLGQSRAALRAYLLRHGLEWDEDPSNVDARFDRIKLREAGPMLADLGLTPEALTQVAENMAEARDVLDRETAKAARKGARVVEGDIEFDAHVLADLPAEILRRLLVSAVVWVARLSYPPRRAAVRAALTQAKALQTASLGGCLLVPHKGKLRICREFNAVRDVACSLDQAWDGRFRLVCDAVAPDEALVRALGEDGLSLCPDWRETGHPRESLLASPSVWMGAKLIAAPMAGRADGFVAKSVGSTEQFTNATLSH